MSTEIKVYWTTWGYVRTAQIKPKQVPFVSLADHDLALRKANELVRDMHNKANESIKYLAAKLLESGVYKKRNLSKEEMITRITSETEWLFFLEQFESEITKAKEQIK